MNKSAFCIIGFGLTLLALSGCAAPSATAVGSAPTTSSAASDEQVSPEQYGEFTAETGDEKVGPSGEEQLALANPAEQTGTPLGLAPYTAQEEEWARTQAPLGTAAAAIEERFASESAHEYFDDSNALVVAFAGSAPAEAVALLEATRLPFLIIEHVGFNRAEYLAAVSNVNDQALDFVSSDVQTWVAPAPNEAPGAIVVTFNSSDETLRVPTPAQVQSISVDEPFTVTFTTGGAPLEFR
jgi:hypothetical protein